MTNAKSTKRALVSSTLAILMCVAMLIGTTFAWFTDTASTGVNKIVSGNLDVDIVGAADDSHVEKLNFTKADDAADEEILWEPGCRYLTEGFRIANKGNLALKWKVQVNKGTTAANDGNFDLLDVIDFYLVTDTGETQTETRLDEFFGNLEKNETSEVYYIKGVMQTTAGNDYQNLTLDGITITVYATQDTVESDSFNNQYDEDAPLDFVPVSTADELAAVFTEAKAGEDVNVSLNADVEITKTWLNALNTDYPAVGDINIQGNGHTITNNNKNSVRGLQIANSTATRTVTISNTNLKLTGTESGPNAKENRGVQLYGLENATINLVNCNIDMSATNYSYAVKVIGSKNLTVNITGCTLTGANCIELIESSSCAFNISDSVLTSNYVMNSSNVGNCINHGTSTSNITYTFKNTTFAGVGAQPWNTGTNNTFTDLGGNVNNTGNQQFAWFN